MPELTTDEVITREAEARKIMRLKSQDDPKFWDEVVKDVDQDTFSRMIEEGYQPPPPVETISAKDLMAKKFPATIWLVKGLIPSEGFTAITGTPTSYKSFLTEHLAVCLTQNQPFLGNFEITPGAVLIIDKENPLSLLQERFLKLGLTSEAQLYFLDNPDHFKLQDQKHLKWLITFIKEKQIKLVILDSFVHIHKGDENDSQAIAQTFEKLKLLPCAIVFIHHHRKIIKFFTGTPLESIRGSSDIAAEVESHLAVDIVQTGLRIAQYKNRRGELTKPFLVIPLVTEQSIIFEYSGEIDEEITKIERAKGLIILHLQQYGETARQQILQGLSENIGRNSIDQALRNMEKNNELKIRYQGRAKYMSLSPDLFPYQGDTTISPLEQSYLEEVE